MKNIGFLRRAVVGGLVAVAGCGSLSVSQRGENDNYASVELNCNLNLNSTRSQMPDPASVFCVQNGGTLRLEEDKGHNQYAICVLSDGRELEEWKFYCGSCPSAEYCTLQSLEEKN